MKPRRQQIVIPPRKHDDPPPRPTRQQIKDAEARRKLEERRDKEIANVPDYD